MSAYKNSEKSLPVLPMASLFVIFSIISISIFSNIASADAYPPVFSDPVPENDSYVSGGDRILKVNISDNELNTSTVTLKIISLNAYEQSEPWDSYPMSCNSLGPSDWECEKTLSFAIVGSDTVELFYFEAEDEDGNYNSTGNQTNPFVFTLDRNPPVLEFINPANNDYVSGIEDIEIDATDSSSGVDNSSVVYSNDSSTWENTTYDSTYYRANWSTSSFSNNQTVTLYARASDMIGNLGYAQTNVTVDNELPVIFITSPTADKKATGIINMKINVSEVYSGIGSSAASYDIEGIKGSMSCSGSGSNYTCQEYFDTTLLTDGVHTFNFTVTDNAGNKNSSSVDAEVDNTEISVLITNPSDGAFVGGDNIYVNATVSNADETITEVNLYIIGYGYQFIQEMECSVDYDCYVIWNTTDVDENMYTFKVNVTNTESKTIEDSISTTLDKTFPQMIIDAPTESTVSGMIYPKVVVTDENGINPDTITFNISTHGSTMECVMYLSGKKYVCSSYFNTTQLNDAYYNLYFYAKDSAGNLNSTSKRLLVDNVQGTGPSGDGNGGNGGYTTTTVGGSGTTVPGSGQTTTTRPTGISAPITIILGDIENVIAPLRGLFSHWPVKVLTIAIIVILIIFAFFRRKLKLLLVRLKYELIFGADKLKMKRRIRKVEPEEERESEHDKQGEENQS